jgi:hypothetical protein
MIEELQVEIGRLMCPGFSAFPDQVAQGDLASGKGDRHAVAFELTQKVL